MMNNLSLNKKQKRLSAFATLLGVLMITGCNSESNQTKGVEATKGSVPVAEYSVQTRLDEPPSPTSFKPTPATHIEGSQRENVVVVAERVLNKDSIMLKRGVVQPAGENGLSSWQLMCDEGGNTYEQSSVNPLSYMTTGISSNLLTQLQRAAEILELNIDSMKVEAKVFFKYVDPMTDDWMGYTDKVVSNIVIQSDEPQGKIQELKALAMKSWVAGEGLKNETKVIRELVINGEHWEEQFARPGNVPDSVSIDNDFKLTSKTSAIEPETLEPGEDIDMETITNPFEFAVVAIAESANDAKRPYLNKIRVRALQENYTAWDLYADDSYESDGQDKAPTSLDYLSAGTAFCLMTQLTVNDMYFDFVIDDYRVEQQFDYRTENYMTPEMAGYSDTIISNIVVNSQASKEELKKYFTQSLNCCFAGEAFLNATEMETNLYLNGNSID